MMSAFGIEFEYERPDETIHEMIVSKSQRPDPVNVRVGNLNADKRR